MSTVSSQAFTIDPTNKTFMAEISDFGERFQFKQIYPDACDEGLEVVSSRTGRTAKWAVSRYEKRDGELVAWHLTPIRRQAIDLIGWKMVIFND